MSNKAKTIEDLGEFGFIRSITSGCITDPNGVVQGIGDDCAVIGPFGEKVLLVTADLLVENVHFILDRIPPEHIGEKAVAVNLSDIAAMGGHPRHVIVSVAISHLFPAQLLSGIYDGIKNACKNYGVNILGGDTSSSPGGLFINVTAIGEADRDKVVYRHGARVGDRIYVCGMLGESIAGLKIIKGEISADPAQWPSLIAAHTCPRPKIEEGEIIGRSGLASAMIDISDGIVADLGHICEQSGVGAEIYENMLPISEDLLALGQGYNLDITEYALMGGEDYALLFTVAPENGDRLEKLLTRQAHIPPAFIGRITSGSSIRCVGPDGKQRNLGKKGFDHFAR